jgi:heme/copper-type cytochrome/quinol oxidase subunit 3
MRQVALGLFPTLKHSLERMSASRISRNGAIVFLVAMNLFATPLFLYFSSEFWAPSGENGPWNAPEDTSLWGYLAIPLLAISLSANIVVIPRVMTEFFYRKDFRLLLIWCACLFVLFSAYAYDKFRKADYYLAPGDDSITPGHGSNVK